MSNYYLQLAVFIENSRCKCLAITFMSISFLGHRTKQAIWVDNHKIACNVKAKISSADFFLYSVASRHVTSRRVTSRRVTSRHAASRHVASRHVTARRVTARHVASRRVTSRHVKSRHVTLRHVKSRHVASQCERALKATTFFWSFGDIFLHAWEISCGLGHMIF